MGTVFTKEVSVKVEVLQVCCGHFIAITPTGLKEAKENHATLRCPYGDNIWWPGETEAERLKKKLEEAQEFSNAYARQYSEAKLQVKGLERENKHLQTRIKNGVCPYCHRSFTNVNRHMASKHKESS